MVFLANVFVPCDMCGGRRFKPDVLEVKLAGESIADVLQWTVDHALTRLHRQPRLARALWHLQQVGLGYLRLGQPATTLSGGEAQRLKIARELALASGGKHRRPGKLRTPPEPTHRPHLPDGPPLRPRLVHLRSARHTAPGLAQPVDLVHRAVAWIAP